MSNYSPTLQGKDFANVYAEHTRRVQLLSGQFWKGDIDMWHYRKLSRELTQQFAKVEKMLLGRAALGEVGSFPLGDEFLRSHR